MRKSDLNKSPSPEEWQALAATTHDQIPRPAGLALQEAQLIRPGAQTRTEQILTAHEFCLEETIEVIQAMEHSHPEKSMCENIAELKAGGKFFCLIRIFSIGVHYVRLISALYVAFFFIFRRSRLWVLTFSLHQILELMLAPDSI